MRGNYKSPSELLLALRETGKSYWDLVGKPLTPNTGYNLNNPHAAEESEYNKWYNGSKLSDEDSEKLQLFLEEYDKDIKSNSNSLPSYKGGKDKFTTFVERMGPKVYRQLHKQGIYNPYIYDNMMRLLAWESNYGTSPLAISNHNYGGVKSSNTEYAKYKDDDAFANYYVSLIRRKYPQAIKARDAKSYARELKKVGYYEDSLQNYSQKLSNMSSVSKAAKLHMYTNPKQYEVEMLLDDLKKQAVQQPVSTRVEPPINKEPINKEPFVNTPIPTKAPLITRPEYLESNSLIKKSFEQNMNNTLLGKEFLFNLPGFKGGKDSGIKEYASNEDMHVNPDGSITTRNGNTGSVILPDVNVYALKDYNSAFDYSGANEVMGTIADFSPVVGDVKQGLETANDLRKGNYKEAAIGAGLLLLPNVLEKPLKYAGKKAFNFLLDKAPDVVSKYLLGGLTKPIYNERSFPAKSLYRADVYRGGKIRNPRNISLTTDPKYAEQYGEVTPYLFESKSVAKAKEPLMGYSDPVNNDMFIYHNTKDVPGANAIVGHDLVTGEFPYNSKGTEIISLSPNNIYPKRLKPSTIEWRDATKTPQITADNAAGITPEQWTVAQDAAIAKGDMTEALRLRNLHAEVKGYSPIHEYHGSNKSFKEFKESPYGIYFTPDESAAEGYVRGSSPTKYDVYLNSGDDVITIDNGGLPWNKISETKAANAFGISKEDLHSIVGKYNAGAQPWYYDYLYPFGFKPKTNYYAVDQLAKAAKQQGKASLKLVNAMDNGKKITAKNRLYDQHIVFKPNQVKSADAVTYDDNGIRIPLGKRDNFSMNDIRYGLLPFVAGLTGYGLLNNHKTSRGSARKGNTKK